MSSPARQYGSAADDALADDMANFSMGSGPMTEEPENLQYGGWGMHKVPEVPAEQNWTAYANRGYDDPTYPTYYHEEDDDPTHPTYYREEYDEQGAPSAPPAPSADNQETDDLASRLNSAQEYIARSRSTSRRGSAASSRVSDRRGSEASTRRGSGSGAMREREGDDGRERHRGPGVRKLHINRRGTGGSMTSTTSTSSRFQEWRPDDDEEQDDCQQ
ncbi:hypothetical protein B9479_005603 [Cryptococcus floricola]|uniref:Uncharacterized protein n=1 Tax=Cryptococcus floricola TaxID=2591691 RepID=A0A5D3AUC3_9TREE|nr:hypothetical protein B9479_005603 [Cryptococcus floricola]